MRFIQEKNLQNREWFYVFLGNSCTTKLKDQIKTKYSRLFVEHKVIIVYLNMMIDVIVFMFHVVVVTLKEYLKKMRRSVSI